MTRLCSIAMAFAVGFVAAAPAIAEPLQLPPEVTPALRAACEQDARRLCIGENPTVAKVRSCMTRRYSELSSRCKFQIVAAGLSPGR